MLASRCLWLGETFNWKVVQALYQRLWNFFGFAGQIDRGFAIGAEIKSIRYGLQLAWMKGYRDVVVESDSSQAVQFICRNSIPPPELVPLVQQCWDLMARNWKIDITHTLRNSYSCADVLVRSSHQFTLGIQDFDILPPCVVNLLARDKVGISSQMTYL